MTIILDLDIAVTSIDQAGFIINIISKSHIISTEINWIAWPENELGIETGFFYGENIVIDTGVKIDIELDLILYS